MKTDPRVKLFYLMIITFWSIISADLNILLLLFFIQIVISFYAKQLIKQFQLLFGLKYFLVIIIGVNLLFFWNRYPHSFYIILLLKIVILILTSASLLGTSSPEELVLAFDRLGLPSELSWTLGSAIRLIDDIKREILQIIAAQKLRGVDFQTKNPFKRAYNMFSILSPLLTHSFVRSSQMAQALSTRQWTGARSRTTVFPLNWTFRDAYFASILFIFGVFLPIAFYFNIINPIK